MRQLEKNDKSSKSLLANVLDLEDDFLICSRGSLSTPNKPDHPNQLPTLIPQSSTLPHINSDTTKSPVPLDQNFCKSNLQNFTEYIGTKNMLLLIF